MIQLKLAVPLLVLSLANPVHVNGRSSSRARSLADTTGAFAIYKLQHRVGAETYTITSVPDAKTIETHWSFRYLGSDVRLTATLETRRDGAPTRFVARGQTSTLTDVDLSIQIGDKQARVRERGSERLIAVPPRSFPVAAYPPLAIEDALFQRWRALGRPRSLQLVPRGTAAFLYRGTDRVTIAGRPVVLRRYMVTGLLWGRQWMWATDDDKQIVAVVNGDAELDRFEAIRDGYTSALTQFVRAAVDDGIAELTRISGAVKPLQGTYALVGATVVDGTGAPPIEDAVVLVRDGLIDVVGSRALVRLPDGISRRDVSGKTIVPGLWDMHVHFEQVEWPAVQLAGGVTTVRDVGNELELATGLRDAIRDGRIPGPRMLLAGLIDGGPNGLGVHLAAKADEARAEVRRYRDAGYQQIKIYQSVPPALVVTITEEAHRVGMTVTGHVPTGMNARQFVEAGADQINHYGAMLAVMQPPVERGQPRPPMDLESEQARSAIAFFKAHGTVLDPTLARYEQNAHPKDTPFAVYEPGAAKAPPELADVLNASGSSHAAAPARMASLTRALPVIGALRNAGIPIVAGTDLVVPGHSMHRELELEVRSGFTPMQAIQAATLVPARVMGLDHESGSIERGKRADLVILDANPLAEISNIRRVHAVVAAGRMFDPAPLWRTAGFIP